jgi:acetyl-CoA/propionyl-CoA carboxylase biotin carboxyl carrier protein
VLGIDTNIGFLRELLAQDGVQSGDMDTGLIDRMPAYVASAPRDAALRAAAAAATRARNDAETVRSRRARTSSARTACGLDEDARSRRSGAAWHELRGWRAGAPAVPTVRRLLEGSGTIHEVVSDDRGGTRGRFDGHEGSTRAVSGPGAAADGGGAGRMNAEEATRTAASVTAVDADGWLWVHAEGGTHRLRPLTRREAMERRLAASGREASAAEPDLRAPMPGAVVAVHAADGDTVAAGDRIVTIEAMKMEHPVLAPHDGVVRLDVAVGEQVRRDQVLAHVSVSLLSDSSSDIPAGAHDASAPIS